MRSILLTLTALLLIPGTRADQSIVLDPAEAQLLGMEFGRVESAAGKASATLSGTVINSPESASEISSRLAGVLAQWLVDAGDEVTENQVIARIRSQDLLGQQQTYLSLANQVELQQQQVERERRLWQGGIIARQRLLQSEGVLKDLRLRLSMQAHELQLAGLEAADLDAMENGGAALGIMLVRAPVDGKLGHRAYRTGQFIEANSLVATVNQPGRLWVSITVPARLQSMVLPGTRVRTIDQGESLTVMQRDLELETDSQTLEALAVFDAASSRIPGEILLLTVLADSQSPYVPGEAVVHEGGETLVFVRTASGLQARPLPMQAIGSGYVVLSGLSVGEEILIKGTALAKGMLLGLGRNP